MMRMVYGDKRMAIFCSNVREGEAYARKLLNEGTERTVHVVPLSEQPLLWWILGNLGPGDLENLWDLAQEHPWNEPVLSEGP